MLWFEEEPPGPAAEIEDIHEQELSK